MRTVTQRFELCYGKDWLDRMFFVRWPVHYIFSSRVDMVAILK